MSGDRAVNKGLIPVLIVGFDKSMEAIICKINF